MGKRIGKLNDERVIVNKKIQEADVFFRQFSKLDNQVYAEGAIPKKYKELTGLSISVLTRCDECVLYHLQECINQNANKNEIIEAIKLGTIGGGSITYPTVRYAYNLLKELDII